MVHWKRTSYNSMDLVLPHFAGSGGSSFALASGFVKGQRRHREADATNVYEAGGRSACL
jgi:hypothetical protein